MFESLDLKQLLENEFFTGGFVLGIITAVVMYMRKGGAELWKRIERKLYYSITIEITDDLYAYFERWLFDNHRTHYRRMVGELRRRGSMMTDSYQYGKDVVAGHGPRGEDDEDEDKIQFRQDEDLIFMRYRGRFVKISKSRERLEQSKDLFNFHFDSFTISTLFNKRVLYKLLDDVVEYNQQFKPPPDKSVRVFSHCSLGWWGNSLIITPKTKDRIVLKAETKTSLFNDIDKFLKSWEWYEERSIPYKRGYLFYGPPGNGKTSLVGAIAHHTGRSVFNINLSQLEDASVRNAFANVSNKSIILMEDIDAAFDGRKSTKSKVTFSNLLQCFDGITSRHDVIVILTTNHIEKLDPALIRDGRIDMKVYIDNPTSDLINQYLNLFYGTDLVKLNGEYTGDKSMSTIQNLCLSSNTPEEAIEKVCM